jgi:hypothetical protein
MEKGMKGEGKGIGRKSEKIGKSLRAEEAEGQKRCKTEERDIESRRQKGKRYVTLKNEI